MKRSLLAICTILCASAFIAACNKNDDATANASLMIVNASPNGSNIDASANGTVIVSNLAYPNNSGYKTLASGNANIIVTETGTTNQILNGTMVLEANTAYTFYVVDSAHKRKASFTRDDRTPPAAGKAKVRLVHLSPNTPAIDVTINGSSNAAFTNRSFNDIAASGMYHAFTEVDAAGLTLQVKLAGTSTVLATLPPLTLVAGKIYTVVIRGFNGGTGSQALGVELITHN
ncbi:MAG TPA: DUF4397 domain-containing protein [Chitinophagaceae bacterium]